MANRNDDMIHATSAMCTWLGPTRSDLIDAGATDPVLVAGEGITR